MSRISQYLESWVKGYVHSKNLPHCCHRHNTPPKAFKHTNVKWIGKLVWIIMMIL